MLLARRLQREVQTLPSGTMLFATTGSGTDAYAVTAPGRLRRVWSNGSAGTSPIVPGGLLYVYDPNGVLDIYLPTSGKLVARLPTGRGHWNAPVLDGGRIALPECDANDQRTSGRLNLYVFPLTTQREDARTPELSARVSEVCYKHKPMLMLYRFRRHGRRHAGAASVASRREGR